MDKVESQYVRKDEGSINFNDDRVGCFHTLCWCLIEDVKYDDIGRNVN